MLQHGLYEQVINNQLAEELYAYDSIMGTNISGFCPENDEDESDDCDEW